MKNSALPLGVIGSMLLAGCSEPPASTAPVRPNIIVIMSDDMGYSDVGCYGSEIKTPNLDRMAENGVRFTQFYNAARCCPTRASLLTGLYPHQAGMGWMTGIETDLEPYQGGLNSNCVTIAEALKLSGYSTFMSGKWHVSSNLAQEGPKYDWPVQRGFDRFYGTITGAGSFFDPATLCRQNTLISPFADSLYTPDEYYYTHAISHEAIRFINERDVSNPFFLYVSYTAPHWPNHALPADIEKYKGVYDEGWEKIREQRVARMKELGVIPQNTELSPLDVHPWEEEQFKDVKAARMEIYAAMIDAMDQGIGQIIDALEKEEILENTVIIYLHDNGGCAEEIGTMGETGPVVAYPGELVPLGKKGIQYVSRLQITREGEPVMKGEGIAGGPNTTYVAYGKVWANASNTPFKEYKHWVHEGGIATPLIIQYPGKTGEENRLVSTPGHVIDIMPTILDLADANYPDRYNGNDILPPEGISLVPLIDGNELNREKAIYWEHQLNRAVRLDDWKLVSKGELLGGPYGKWTDYQLGPWELYNIKDDRSEMNDLSEKFSERVNEMARMWDEYAQRTGVFPTPWK